MNETILIITVASIVGVLLGRLIPWLATRLGKVRPAEAQANQQIEVRTISKEPSLPPQPAGPRRSVATLVIMTLLVVVWGLMVGFAVSVFSHLLYIVFLFPLIMGINSGKMIVNVVQKAKIRTASQLIFLSILSAVAIYGTFHYTKYIGFQVKALVEIFSGLDETTEEENLQVTKAFLDYALEEETGHSGFLGYILYEAQQGVTIGRLFRSTTFNLGPALTWLYWLMEFGIILGVTIQKGRKAMNMSSCEACGNWHSGEKHLGGTASANETILLEMLKQKDFTGLGTLIQKNAEVPSLELYFQGCQVCGKSQSQLVVRRTFQSAKGNLQFTDATQTILQPNESVLLLNQLSFSGD